MVYGERSWHTLLMPEIETLDQETAQSIAEFANAGGKIVFIEKVPFKSPSFKNQKSRDAEVERIISNLLKGHQDNVHLIPAPKGNPILWFENLQNDIKIKPYVRFSKTDKFLSQSCYKLAGNWLFFIANTSLDKDLSLTAEFHVEEGSFPWVWDSETGKRWLHSAPDKTNKINLELPRATSRLIVFEKSSDSDGEILPIFGKNAGGLEITGSWQLQLNQMNGARQMLEMEQLTDLIENEETKHFAGTLVYEKTIITESDNFQFIDLGKVHGITELSLNNQFVGTRWYGKHTYDIREVVKKGENKLSVKLITITGNYLKSLNDNPVAQRWTRNQPYYSMGILGPVRIY